MTNSAENHYLDPGSESVIINCYLFITFWCLFVWLFFFYILNFSMVVAVDILLYANILIMSGYTNPLPMGFQPFLMKSWSGVAPFFLNLC